MDKIYFINADTQVEELEGEIVYEHGVKMACFKSEGKISYKPLDVINGSYFTKRPYDFENVILESTPEPKTIIWPDLRAEEKAEEVKEEETKID